MEAKYFRNVIIKPDSICMIEVDDKVKITVSYGDSEMAEDQQVSCRPYSMNHEVKKLATNGKYRYLSCTYH